MNRHKKIVITLTAIILFSGNIMAEEQLGKINIHGFVSQGYLKTNKNNYLAQTEEGSLEFNELGINFTTNLTDRLRMGMQLFARDMGANGNDELVVDWANADYHWRDWLGVRIGRNKGFIGFYTETRDLDMLRTNILLPQSVYSELFRDSFSSSKSIDFYGRILLGAAGLLAYEAGVGTPNFSENTGISHAFTQAFSALDLKIDTIEPGISPAIRATWYAPLEGFRVKAGWYEGNDLLISGKMNLLPKFEYTYDFDGYFVSTEYQQEKLTLVGEYASSEIQGKWDLGLGYEERRPVRYEGWYVALNYDFSEFFKTGISYSSFYPDVDNKDGKRRVPSSMYYDMLGLTGKRVNPNADFESWLKTTTLSFRFDINEFWLFKLEASYNDGFGAYTSAKNPDGVDRYWFLYAAKATYMF